MRGLVRHFTLFFVDIATRQVHGRASLERAIADYVAPFDDERSHQGLGNEIPSGAPVQREGAVEATERLGGLLKYYHRRAA